MADIASDTVAAAAGLPTVLPPPVLDQETEIVPRRSRVRVRDLPGQWPVITELARRDFKAKYKQSLLGPAWLLIQPLALLGALSLAFSGRSFSGSEAIPYAAIALAGLSVWSFFQASLMIGAGSIVANYTLVRRTMCPRIAFPIAATMASLPSLALTLAGALVASAVSGRLRLQVLLLPVGLLWLMVLTLAAVGVVASLTVRARDLLAVLPFAIQIGLFVSPVGYALGDYSRLTQILMSLNPLTGLLEFWRYLLLGIPSTTFAIPLSGTVTVVLALVSWRLFARLEVSMADVI